MGSSNSYAGVKLDKVSASAGTDLDLDANTHVYAERDGGSAYSGSSGPADGGDSITAQKGIINLNALNFGHNGGRGGLSASGNARGGESWYILAARLNAD